MYAIGRFLIITRTSPHEQAYVYPIDNRGEAYGKYMELVTDSLKKTFDYETKIYEDFL